MNKNNENEADAKFKGGLMGAMMGGAVGGGGHWAVEKFMPSMAAGKLNKNTMVATALTTAALGAYIGAVEMWETYLPRGMSNFPLWLQSACLPSLPPISHIRRERWEQEVKQHELGRGG
jgi:hypothetical protein